MDDIRHLKGPYYPEPLVHISEFCVEIPDGSFKEYSANVLAEKTITQFDDGMRVHLLLYEIGIHRTTDAAQILRSSVMSRKSCVLLI